MTAVPVAGIRLALLVAGGSLALMLRLAVGGRPAGGSVPAAAVFCAVLLLLAAASGWRPHPVRLAPVLAGVGGAFVLCLLPLWRLLAHGAGGAAVLDGFPRWGLAVAAVAVAEEVVLRGALHDVVSAAAGDGAAVAVGAVAFALLHVPLYGSGSIVLNLGVGAWLGTLRVGAGTVTAPAVAHTVADWGAWWLR